MKSYKDLDAMDKAVVKDCILSDNTATASRGLLGLAVKKLAPTKENKKKFDLDFSGHSLCGCYGCMELAKIFIDKSPDIQEEIVEQSTRDLEAYRTE
jgi:hypothetical protein